MIDDDLLDSLIPVKEDTFISDSGIIDKMNIMPKSHEQSKHGPRIKVHYKNTDVSYPISSDGSVIYSKVKCTNMKTLSHFSDLNNYIYGLSGFCGKDIYKYSISDGSTTKLKKLQDKIKEFDNLSDEEKKKYIIKGRMMKK